MKTVISFFFLIYSSSLISCELKQNIVSLSGPMTMMLEETKLLEKPQVLAISKFHPVKNSTKKRLAGGVFLAKKTMEEYRNAIIFYDKSKNLSNSLGKVIPAENLIEINSREKDPFDVSIENLGILNRYVTNCSELNNLLVRLKKEKKQLSKLSFKKKAVFFLGTVKKKLPQQVIANDGVVLFLKKHNGLKSYPSTLAYVPWSQKILKKLDGYSYIGMEDGSNDLLQRKDINHKRSDWKMRGIFIPGIRQVYLLKNLLLAGDNV